MNANDARQLLVAAVQAAVATITPTPAVQWDNRLTVDLAKEQNLHLRVEFIVSSGAQISLGSQRVDRYRGVLAVLACVKEGEGVAKAWDAVEKVTKAVQCRSWPGLTTETSMPERARVEKGWYIIPVGVPFYYDDVALT